MSRFFLFMLSVLLITACHNQGPHAGDQISIAEQEVLLNVFGDNMSASITDLTEAKQTPTNEFLLNTHYPLSVKERSALKAAEQHQGSFATDLADRIRCTIMRADLQNEKGQAVALADTAAYPLYIQRFGLWDYEQQLSQNLGIGVRTISLFSELKGTVRLKLQFDGNTTKLINVPVLLSVSQPTNTP